MSTKIMVSDGNPIGLVISPTLAPLHPSCKIRAVESLELGGITKKVRLVRCGKNRRVRIVRIAVVRPPSRKVLLVVASVDLGGERELSNIIDACAPLGPFPGSCKSRQ